MSGHFKTGRFEERIALAVVETAQRRVESTQSKLAVFGNDLGCAWLVAPADCAWTWNHTSSAAINTAQSITRVS